MINYGNGVTLDKIGYLNIHYYGDTPNYAGSEPDHINMPNLANTIAIMQQAIASVTTIPIAIRVTETGYPFPPPAGQSRDNQALFLQQSMDICRLSGIVEAIDWYTIAFGDGYSLAEGGIFFKFFGTYSDYTMAYPQWTTTPKVSMVGRNGLVTPTGRNGLVTPHGRSGNVLVVGRKWAGWNATLVGRSGSATAGGRENRTGEVTPIGRSGRVTLVGRSGNVATTGRGAAIPVAVTGRNGSVGVHGKTGNATCIAHYPWAS